MAIGNVQAVYYPVNDKDKLDGTELYGNGYDENVYVSTETTATYLDAEITVNHLSDDTDSAFKIKTPLILNGLPIFGLKTKMISMYGGEKVMGKS